MSNILIRKIESVLNDFEVLYPNEVEKVRTALKDLEIETNPVKHNYLEILKAIENRIGISPREITGKSRKREIVDARILYIRLYKDMYPYRSLKRIGQTLDDRAHATIYRALNRFDDLYFIDKEFKSLYEDLKKELIK